MKVIMHDYNFIYDLGGSREATKMGGKRDETSTEEKGTKNETIKSEVYVRRDFSF